MIKAISPNEARGIMTALSGGTVPLGHAYTYNVGREEQIEVVTDEILNGTKRLRFINGDYGTGKTHFLATIRHWCVENDFVPSHVVLSPRGTPLYNLNAVYSRIVKNLFLGDDNLSPIESVLEFLFSVFQDWVKAYLSKDLRPRCQKYLLEPLYCPHCNRKGDIEQMYIANFRSLDYRFQTALILYRWARWGHNPDFDRADLVIRWLEGQALYRQELNYLGLWDNLGTRDIVKGLNEIAKLFAPFKKKGIVIMLDEAEGIEKLSESQRQAAYQNLSLLVEAVTSVDKVFFLYATTPSFYSDVREYSSDLATFIESTPQTSLKSLSLDQTRQLLERVAQIYIISLDNSFSEIHKDNLQNLMKQYCNNYTVNTELLSVRNIITDTIIEFKRMMELPVAGSA